MDIGDHNIVQCFQIKNGMISLIEAFYIKQKKHFFFNNNKIMFFF